ncbi:uncharacterized protein LOC134260556 [Saccostrea cucullata]|uniref:uncharacterized protein LOC134260556 n=1 Tax=Saccostrea cuccullata TaxID=36930 RepID=UPI002ED1E37E
MAAPIDKLFMEIDKKFNIVLSLKQKQAINGLFNLKDVFVGTKTGSGKSMTYECAPILFDNGTTLIISPLTSIMKEQVERLKGLGYKAIYIGTEEDDINGIRNGHYHFVFGSPELLVGNDKWLDVIKSSSFQSNHRLTVVDGAHTVVHWGQGSAQESPFREWFSHIGELRSLSLNVPVLALTATASPTNRKKIMKSLCFKADNVVILDNPDRQNIKITVITIPNNVDNEKLFHWLIKGVMQKKSDFERHLIFCSSIKDCSHLFCMLSRLIGSTELVNMYQSKTPEFVKENIRTDMGSETGKIRVLICTNAAGMGVNFKNLHCVIHYGVPHDLDTFVQQMGRAGRDSTFSEEILLVKKNKKLFKKIDPEILRLVSSENECRRQIISSAYLATADPVDSHLCCDACNKKCNCRISHATHPLHGWKDVSVEEAMTREVAQEDRLILRHKLRTYKEQCPTVPSIDVLQDDSISLLVDNVDKIFSMEDVMKYGSIWTSHIAMSVLDIINDVFLDNEMYDISENEIDDSSSDYDVE